MTINLIISANLSWPPARLYVRKGQVVGHGSFIPSSLVAVFRELTPLEISIRHC